VYEQPRRYFHRLGHSAVSFSLPVDPTTGERRAPTYRFYDATTDTLSIIVSMDTAVAESDEGKTGVILDSDEDGNLVSLKILDASERSPRRAASSSRRWDQIVG
jgi:uncharacterized protein YuzE